MQNHKKMNTAMLIATMAAVGTVNDGRPSGRMLPAREFTDECKCGSRKWQWSMSAKTYICTQCGRKAS